MPWFNSFISFVGKSGIMSIRVVWKPAARPSPRLPQLIVLPFYSIFFHLWFVSSGGLSKIKKILQCQERFDLGRSMTTQFLDWLPLLHSRMCERNAIFPLAGVLDRWRWNTSAHLVSCFSDPLSTIVVFICLVYSKCDSIWCRISPRLMGLASCTSLWLGKYF